MTEIKEIFEEIVSLDTSELRFGSVQSFPPPYLHKEPDNILDLDTSE